MYVGKNKHFHLTYKAILNLSKKYSDAPWVALEILRNRGLRLAENKKLLNFLSKKRMKISKEKKLELIITNGYRLQCFHVTTYQF
jgi:hypothetical protein